MSGLKKIWLWSLFGLFTAAVGLVLYGSTLPLEQRFKKKLIELLPPADSEWKSEIMPLADSVESQKRIANILNYDEAVYAHYYGPNECRVSFYMAYWAPGTSTPRQVASHIPDVCWVNAGWKVKPIPEFSTQESDSIAIRSAQRRVFIIHDRIEYVWFWHLDGGRSVEYDENQTLGVKVRAALDRKFLKRKEQILIRISSNRNLNSLIDASPIGNFLGEISKQNIASD